MIYFIQDSGSLLIKIGFTDGEATARLRALQTGCPSGLVLLACHEGEKANEAALHQQFASARERGEWFRPIPDLLKFICQKEWQRGHEEYLKDDMLPLPRCAEDHASAWPRTIYLAGKIQKGDWRASMVCTDLDTNGYCCPDGSSSWLPDDWPVLAAEIFGLHHYAGPYFLGCDHGCFHGNDTHGVAAGELYEDHGGERRSGDVVRLCHAAIERSDLVFAWIDQGDCYGTIAELGAAYALGKRIWIAGPRRFRDMWFVYEYAEKTAFGCRGALWEAPKEILSIWLSEEEKKLSVASNGVAHGNHDPFA